MRTLYRNGRVYSPADPQATALLVDGATISWIGNDQGASTLLADEIVDLDDAFLAPAFVDAHVHSTSTGLALTALDLSAARSLAEALDLIEGHARASRGRPVMGGGWDESAWPEGRAPTRHELDRAGYGGLVYLARVDAHSAIVSSSLAATIDGLAGLCGYSAELLTLDAHHAARRAAYSTLTTGQVRDAQRATRRRAAQLGIGCLQEMAGPEVSSEDDLTGLMRFAADEPGPDVFAYWGELLAVDKARELGAIGAGGDLFCDGSLGSHTAALTAPYADRPDISGVLRFTTEEVVAHLLQCAEAGVQAGFHAIGDAAIDQILGAVEGASEKLGYLAGAGHRVEHAEFLRDPDRFARAGLTASIQPAFDAAWGGGRGMYAQRLGARAGGLNRFASLASAGIPLAFGSDAPVTPMDPWGTVRAAVHPRVQGSGISPRSAFAAHTRGGWRAMRRPAEGVLAVGAAATFAVWEAGEIRVGQPDNRVSRWSTDPLAAVPGLPDVTPGVELPICLQTVVRGRTIFKVGAP